MKGKSKEINEKTGIKPDLIEEPKQNKNKKSGLPRQIIKKATKGINFKKAVSRLASSSPEKTQPIRKEENSAFKLELELKRNVDSRPEKGLLLITMANGYFNYETIGPTGIHYDNVINQNEIGFPITDTTSIEDLKQNIEALSAIMAIVQNRGQFPRHKQLEETLLEQNNPEILMEAEAANAVLKKAALKEQQRLVEYTEKKQPSTDSTDIDEEGPPQDLPPLFQAPPEDLPPDFPITIDQPPPKDMPPAFPTTMDQKPPEDLTPSFPVTIAPEVKRDEPFNVITEIQPRIDLKIPSYPVEFDIKARSVIENIKASSEVRKIFRDINEKFEELELAAANGDSIAKQKSNILIPLFDDLHRANTVEDYFNILNRFVSDKSKMVPLEQARGFIGRLFCRKADTGDLIQSLADAVEYKISQYAP